MHTVRYAHIEGYTDLCLADSGNILTTGEDGDVRIWQGFDDVDSTSIRVSDKCFAIAYNGGKIYVADDLNEVKKYDLKSTEFQGVVTSFTLPVTCICVNKSGTQLVCGSSDFDIHLVDLGTLKFSSLTGHEAPILSLCFDPLEKYFVSTSCDGTARFWAVNTLNMAKMLPNLHPKSNDFNDSESMAKVAWHKDGGLIAVPCMKEIHFYERETWLQKFKISLPQSDAGGSDDFLASILCFSPDGKHILASTNTQMIYVHSIINKSMVYKYSYTKKSRICSLVWNTANPSEIIFCDIKGHMGSVKPSLKDSISGSTTSAPATTTSESKEATSASAAKSSAGKSKKPPSEAEDDNLKMEDLLNLLDSDEKSNDSNEDKMSRSSSSKDVVKSPSKKRKRLNEDEDSNDPDNEFYSTNIEEEIDGEDDDLESLEKLKIKSFRNAKKEVMAMVTDEDADSQDTAASVDGQVEAKKEAILQKLTKLASSIQPAFQPASTPLNLTQRYMAWNSVGLITQFNKQNDESMDIEFHNATYHHTIHVQNQLGHTMADMSKEAVVLACPGTKYSDNGEASAQILSSSSTASAQSKLVCIQINSWDGSKEWSVAMPKKEQIKCVCASRFLVACATNHKFLRIFSISGTQKEIVALNGSPVCASAYDNCVFVCYHLCIGETTSTIGYSLYYLDDPSGQPKPAEHGVISLSEGAKLEWAGFSDEGTPYYYDSNGYLYTRCSTLNSKSSTWTPISYLKAGLTHKSDHYWVVGVAERKQMVKAILCKGAKYPQVLPRPNIAMVSMQIPFCETENEKVQQEQEFWRNKYLHSNIKTFDTWCENLEMEQEDLDDINAGFEGKLKELLMKMFILACKSEKEKRAYEIATMMDSMSLQLAIKYATKTRALVLSQHLNLLIEKKAEMEYSKKSIQYEHVESTRPVSSSSYQTQYMDTTSKAAHEMSSVRETQSQMHQTPSSMMTSTCEAVQASPAVISLDEDSMRECATPTAIPLTNTRLNPFKVHGGSSSGISSLSSSAKKVLTPHNESGGSKSIMNEIEEKVSKLHQSAGRDKDAWKPSPMSRKLANKSATPGSKINNFFNKN